MDAELIASWGLITDPCEAIGVMLEHENFLGYDPYYADMRRALMKMLERIDYKCTEGKNGN